MKPLGYIASGVGCAVLGVLVLFMAHSNDGVQDAMTQAQLAAGKTASPSSDGLANLIGLVLFLAAVVLILIGAIGAGVRAGKDDA
jgi:hypothetical protein